MNRALRKVFDTLEIEKENLLKRVSELSEEKLNCSIKPGKWSINQILSHVMEAERFSIQYMKKKSLGIDQLQNSGLKEEMKSIILILSQRIPFLKYKAPRVISESSVESISLQEIKTQWSGVRSEMKNLLEDLEEKNIRKKIYKHPVAGYLNARQGVSFLREHLLHHLPQIKKLLS